MSDILDCQDAFEKGERKSGAVYILRPDPSLRLIWAVCQFDHESGWTVIQRRLDGTVDFYRGWEEYVDGFGYMNGEYWMGLEAIYLLTKTNRRLSIFLESHDGEVRTANYSSFYIDESSTDYVNYASGYSGDAGDSWTGDFDLNNMKFTTFDKDNDMDGSNCAAKFHGAWWYRSCHRSNLNAHRRESKVEIMQEMMQKPQAKLNQPITFDNDSRTSIKEGLNRSENREELAASQKEKKLAANQTAEGKHKKGAKTGED
ncbi:ficolin-1-like [Watersipora subatra]|uniref:ficolin-1-like n=1 Tax=Watersipora subatra TaxID=2589382 RepID=UPI00355BD37A